MNSYRTIFYHIVFCTYYRRNTMPAEHHEKLYKYIWGIIKNRKSVLFRINGTENHIHFFSDLHPTVCLADYIKEIKTASNRWMKQSGKFPEFEHWAEGYGALTYSDRDKDMIINYIKKQKEQHATVSFEDEYRNYSKRTGLSGMKSTFFDWETPAEFWVIVVACPNPRIYPGAQRRSSANKSPLGLPVHTIINAKVLATFQIPLPGIETQRQIVAQIEKEQVLVNANKQLIEIFEQKIKDRIAKVWGVEKTEEETLSSSAEQCRSMAAEPVADYEKE